MTEYIAIGSLILAVIGAAISIATSRAAVTKTEVDTLSTIITALQARVEALETELARWKRRYRALAEWVRNHGLDPDDAELAELVEHNGRGDDEL